METENDFRKTAASPFELLDTLNRQRHFAHLCLGILFVICCLLMATVLYTASKPPLVIRIDKLGNTQIVENYGLETAQISEEDIKNFTQVFLENYVGLRSDLVIAQFEKSLNMMTDDFAKYHLQSMKENNTIKAIQAANVRNDVVVSVLSSEAAGELIYINLAGTIQTRPLAELNAVPQAKKVKADLVLLKTRRTPKHPFGLLLKDIKLSINKDSEEINNNMHEVVE